MDTSQMMMASGGIIAMAVTLLTLLLPLIMLILLWKISKATSSTANQLERLIAQVDLLVQRAASAPTPAVPASRSPERTPAARSDAYDLLAAGTAAATTAAATRTTEEVSDNLAAAFNIDSEAEEPVAAPPAPQEEEEDSGFEFPVDDEVFGDLAPADDETESFSAAPAPEAEEERDTFDFPLDEDLPAAEEDFSSDFGIEDQPREETEEGLSDEEEAALGGAFDTPGDEEETEEEAFGTTSDEEFAEAPAEEEPVAAMEESPAIVKLEDDPARPEVSMARCGRCDHKLAYKKSLAGRKARCPSCKEAFILP